MRVALDLSSLDHERLSGIGVYVGQLAQALAARSDIELSGVWNPGRFLKRNWIIHHSKGIECFPWIPWISERRFDLYHGPDFRLPALRRIKRVLTLHDLAFYQPGMTSPEFAERSRLKVEHALLKGRPDCVIAVSEFTKKEILDRFPQYAGRVFTVPHGADHLLAPDPEVPSRVEGTPYFLFVGNLEARKNVTGLLTAFDLFCERSPSNRDARLILVGSPGYGFDSIAEKLSTMKSRDRVELKGYLSKGELIRLYRGSRAFLYPSLHEGFGFPVLEAMSLGVPVLTSDCTATAEVAGDGAAVLVNPASLDELSEGIHRLWNDESLREKAINSGKSRAASFRWAEAARRTALVYRAAVARE